MSRQGTLHRKWITSEADLDSNHTYPNTTRARDYSHEWTTLAREMQAHGASWINILKVGTAIASTIAHQVLRIADIYSHPNTTVVAKTPTWTKPHQDKAPQ